MLDVPFGSMLEWHDRHLRTVRERAPVNSGTAFSPALPAARGSTSTPSRGVRDKPDPVREALLELSFEGLFRSHPHGVTVIGISPPMCWTASPFRCADRTGSGVGCAAHRTRRAQHAARARADVVARSGDDSIGEANWQFTKRLPRRALPRLMTQIKQARAWCRATFSPVPDTRSIHSTTPRAARRARCQRCRRSRVIAERHVLDAGRSLVDWLEQRRTPEG